MPRRNKLLFATLIFVICAIIFFTHNKILCYKKLMDGFWVIDPTFALESGITDMYIIFLDDTGYLIGTSGDDVIFNTPVNFDISYMSKFCASFGREFCLKNVGIKFVDEEQQENIFPTLANITLSCENASMSIYNDDGVFGHFYKDYLISSKI
jgi:hypothetical protein